MTTATDEWLPTRQSLLARLKDWDDQESWRDFYDTYWRLIYGVAIKSGLSSQEAEDVLQETILTLARQMRKFTYDPALGSFKGWLLRQTRWRIADHLRKRQKNLIEDRDHSNRTTFLERVPDTRSMEVSESLWEAEWRNNLVTVALENIKKRVSARTLQIFQLSVVNQWPASRVAKALSVSCAQVYVARHRVSTHLEKEMKRLAKKYS